MQCKAGTALTGTRHPMRQVTAWHKSGGWHYATVADVLAAGKKLKVEWSDGDQVLDIRYVHSFPQDRADHGALQTV